MVQTTTVPSLYVHVPFCAAKCHYCAFYSAPPSADLASRYVNALLRELQIVAPDLSLLTLFFGGGTPSLLTLKQWEMILNTIQQLGLSSPQEWTVECNPATVSLDKAKLLKAGGVNRISMGVQSLDDSLLDRLGRVHSRDMVFRSLDILREAGFENINIDLMFAIPGQTREVWQATLREAVQLGSTHLSSYEVIFEEDTALYAQLKAGEFDVDEDLACMMYEDLVEIAGSHGFHQYEVANFAKHDVPNPSPSVVPQRACQHNINYWRGGAFHGLGPSAAGFMNGVRTKNWSNTQLYCDQLEHGVRAIESRDTLPPIARAGEIAGFGLRMNAGWPFEAFRQTTGFDLRDHWKTEMSDLVEAQHALWEPDGFRLTETGLRFADAAASRFLVTEPGIFH